MTPFATIPASLTRFILGQLYWALPFTPEQDPEFLEIRNQAALAAILRLAPMNTAEALLAVHAIASEAHANAALREAVESRGDLRVVGQCRAQSALMIRQAMQVRKELRTMQEIRRSAEFQRMQEDEAAEREARETIERADETGPAPFIRRLAERRRSGMGRGASHEMGQTANNRSMRLNPESDGISDHIMRQDQSGPTPARGRRWPAVA